MDIFNTKKFDLCVIGTGSSGLITALEYSKLHPEKQIILIEFGNKSIKNTNALDDSIKISNLKNHHPPYECTNKGFGGTSATWGGRCVNFDEVDFIERPIVNNGCTWDVPFYKDVEKYLLPAAEYFECGEAKFNLNDLAKFKDDRIAEGFVEGDVTDSIVERWSMPTRFGDRYHDDIQRNKNIILLEGFEAINFSVPNDSGIVKDLKIKHVETGDIKTVSSSLFVIATGTQEVTRLLLKNLQLFNNLAKVPDALGKYYQGHISGKIASVKFYGNPQKTEFGFIKDEDGVYLRRRFQYSKDFLVDNNLLNTAIWLDNPLYHNPKHKSGAMSFMYMAMITPFLGKRLAPPAIAQSITKGKVEGLKYHLLNIIKDLPKSLITPATIFYKRYLLKRKLPGIFLYSPQNKYALHFHAEQIPDASNRMYLADDNETLIIDYNILDADALSVIKVHEKLDDYLRGINCGELEYWYKKNELLDAIKSMSRDGIHQSGTTRIADTPEKGVVDRNLQLFGTANVYVCSCSVLPTSGQANPTFFTGALAVKLAHHLK